MWHWFGGIEHLRDIAASLTEQYNNYAGASEDFPILDEEWVAEKLPQIMHSSDLELLLEDEFGKGLIMGQLRFLHTMEEVGEESAAEGEDELNG